MSTAQVVETSVTVNNNRPIQDYVHPDDQTQPTFHIFSFLTKASLSMFINYMINGFIKVRERLVHVTDTRTIAVKSFMSLFSIKAGIIPKITYFCILNTASLIQRKIYSLLLLTSLVQQFAKV